MTKKTSLNFKSPGPQSNAELGLFIEKIRDLAERDPRKAAIILTEWMNSKANSIKEEKKKTG